jgi:hypothetical protein
MLDKDRLKASIISKLSVLLNGEVGEWEKIAEAVSEAVIEELQDNAVVTGSEID